MVFTARACVEECEKTGCVGDKCFQHCSFSSDGNPIDGPWYLQEPLYIQWKQWDCRSDCRYHCMLSREEERQKLGYQPVKYHGKWPFKRIYGIQVKRRSFVASQVYSWKCFHLAYLLFYHTKFSWSHQEPVSVALSALNLAVQFHGWVSFFILVNYKLPFRPNKKTYYDYTGLWNIYAVFAMNAWFWSAVFHSRCASSISSLLPSPIFLHI